MITSIPDLWPDDINVKVLPPIAVLKAQEGQLARHTHGLLQAKLTTTETDKLVQHQLDLIAPSLNFYRERLLSATHDREMLYPVTVTAECFAPKSPNSMQALGAAVLRMMDPSVYQRKAATDEEFIQLVKEVLQSADVRALIHSLIARINQQTEASQQNRSVEPNKDASEGQAN